MAKKATVTKPSPAKNKAAEPEVQTQTSDEVTDQLVADKLEREEQREKELKDEVKNADPVERIMPPESEKPHSSGSTLVTKHNGKGGYTQSIEESK